MTRLSSYFLPTEKQAPADAEALSHKLMVRAGLIRQMGAGLWTWLPAGWRVQSRIAAILREEMNAIGGQEMLMPLIQPAELWRRSGRYAIEELFKLEDRRGADLVLAMTHEEAVTSHVARIVRSYRELPLILYHLQTKGRDEPRPRAGVLRTREFVMKDSYTFDRDQAGLERSYAMHIEAYDRIFDRVGLRTYRVAGDVGLMGGTGAHEYMAPCAAGENDVALAPGYAANVEVASATPQPVSLDEDRDTPLETPTPGASTVAAVAAMLGLPTGALLKAFPVVVGERGLVLVMLRGDHRVNEIKLGAALGAAWRPADRGRDPRATSARRGSSARSASPSGLACCSTTGWRGQLHHRRQSPGLPPPRRSSRAGTSTLSAPTSAPSRQAIPSPGTRSRSSRRSRSATSSSSGRATRRRSARPTSTSTAASS